ncbi:MAG: hypothetical protein HXX17_05815, partial [Geobacteraceae bacterium]|nr:hypothetical protein [Geobacteraceae bacterium]
MLKRFMPALISLILLLAVSNNALAVFADLELIRVYYDRSGSEIATDLGNVKTILSSGSTQTYAGSFGSPSLTNGYAAYFALSSATGELWATNVNITGATFTPVIIGGGTGLTSIKSGTTNMYSTYNLKGGTNYTGLASVINSYKNKISATQGWFANTITAANSARS